MENEVATLRADVDILKGQMNVVGGEIERNNVESEQALEEVRGLLNQLKAYLDSSAVLILSKSQLEAMREEHRGRELAAKAFKDAVLKDYPDDLAEIERRKEEELKARGMKENVEALLFKLTGTYPVD